MVDSHLIPTNSPTNNTSVASLRTTVGTRFTVAASTYLTAIRYWRKATTAASPTSLLFWNVSNGNPVVQVAPVDNGTVGWQQTALATPVQLFPGQTYCVGADQPLNMDQGYWSPHIVPDSGITWAGAFWGNNNGGTNQLPTNNAGDADYPYDAILSPQPDPVIGATTTDVANQLEDYLGTSDNTHHDALPWATKAELDAIKVEVDDLQAKANGTNGFAAIKAVADAIAAIAGGIPGTVASAVTAIAGSAATLTGTVITQAGATLTSISHDIADVETHVTDKAAEVIEHVTGSSGTGASATDVPDSDTWTLAGETDFDTSLAWDVAADVYTVRFDTYPASFSTSQPSGVPVVYRLASWAILAGDYGRERHYVDFPHTHLTNGGRRMPGVLLMSNGPTTGHIQAWLRPGS
jgi:hypothetical protein